MPISSYQVEWLIHQRRRWRGLKQMVARALFASPDKVELSQQGREQSGEARPAQDRPRNGADLWPEDLADRHVYPPPVAHELERRAGSFMKPKYVPQPPAKIPRVPLRKSRREPEDEE